MHVCLGKIYVNFFLFSSKGSRGIWSAEDSEGNPGVHSAGNDGIQRESLSNIAGEVSFLFLAVSFIAPKVVKIWYVQLFCFMFTKKYCCTWKEVQPGLQLTWRENTPPTYIRSSKLVVTLVCLKDFLEQYSLL